MDNRTEKLLASLRQADPVESSTVDIARAVQSGRRAAATRRGAGVIAVAAVTAAVVLGLHAWWPGGQRSPATRPAVFNALRQVLTVGTAGGYAPSAYLTGTSSQQAYLRSTGQVAGLPATATVTVYPAGQLPSAGWRPGTESAPQVRGRDAFWSARATAGSATELAWQWRPGSWAIARIDATGQLIRAQLGNLAQSVQPADEPARLPFTVADPGHGARITATLRRSDNATFAVQLGSPTADGSIWVGVSRHRQDIGSDFPDPLQVGVVSQVRKLTDQWSGFGWADSAETERATTGSGGLKRLLESITIAGSPGDPDSWPDRPLR